MIYKPYEALGEIRFGMSKEEVRNKLNGEFTSHTDLLKQETDLFITFGLKVYYDKESLCEAVDAFEPANPIFDGMTFVGKKYSEVKVFISIKDPDAEETPASLVSLKYGFLLYMEHYPTIECFTAFREGFYTKEYSEDEIKEHLKAYEMADLKEYGWWKRQKIRLKKFLRVSPFSMPRR